MRGVLFALVFVLPMSFLALPGWGDRGIIDQDQGAAAEFYFPPQSGPWETVEPESVGWRAERLDAVLDFARRNNSTGIVILHRGRILAERYWKLTGNTPQYTRYQYFVGDDADGHPIEDVASVQKSVLSFLIAKAVERELLDLDQSISDLLGVGWSNAEPDLESQVTVRHLATMTSGLDGALNLNSSAGEVWRYSGAFKKLIPILEVATGRSIQTLTSDWLLSPIGMNDSRWVSRAWASGVALASPIGFATSARDAARFGLLVLARGKWEDVHVLHETAIAEMLASSQDLNPSYGFLWWHNGREGPRTPDNTFGVIWGRQRGPIVRTAPDDLVAASGHLARRIYIAPSLALVVTRLGAAPLPHDAETSPDSFDDKLWRAIMGAAPVARD